MYTGDICLLHFIPIHWDISFQEVPLLISIIHQDLEPLKNPAMVAIFTYHDPVLEKKGSKIFQNQGIAYSVDKGRTWTKYQGNPVLKNPGIRDFRDPKMFWNDEIGKWELIMAVYDRVHIYSSPDIKNWTFESEFGKGIGAHGGVWECPDLFPLES